MVMQCEYNHSDNNANGINLELRDVRYAVLISRCTKLSSKLRAGHSDQMTYDLGRSEVSRSSAYRLSQQLHSEACPRDA